MTRRKNYLKHLVAVGVAGAIPVLTAAPALAAEASTSEDAPLQVSEAATGEIGEVTAPPCQWLQWTQLWLQWVQYCGPVPPVEPAGDEEPDTTARAAGTEPLRTILGTA